ncbi:MAG: DNA-protecting protein DprA [Chloroflexota bacterium]|nr:MAG: DNA protecting protein DprA [Anaerolineaceae bacterium 4572_5.2]RLD04809.1 MAG: DNA-protecting protein DprA [Chloroflexota bacterium]
MHGLKQYWIGFNLVKGIGPVRLQSLLNVFGDVKTAWEASAVQLQEAGLSSKLIARLLQVRADVSLEQVLQNIHRQKITALTWEDETYPARLKEIPQSPPVLYVRGELKMEDEWAVAIVGTRRFTSYGGQVAERVAGMLARNGVTIVSGLARGVDAIAHRAALEAGGRTVAVLGNGVDRIYPPEHRTLAQEIAQHGAIVSDYPLGTPPDGSNFPPRNRIISGLSKAVIVVEASQRSGALITANYAVEQGREVFAVPGNIYAPQSTGTNRLIKKGAHPLLDPQDVLELLDMTQITEQKTARVVLPSNSTEATLFEVLDMESLHVDEISAKSNLPVEEVTSTLALMELKGMVRKLGGMKYEAVREIRADYRTEE